MITLPVKTEDALAADWSDPPVQLSTPISVDSGPVTIAWIMSPPSPTSGGHQNLFRFIDFAEKAGHRCLIYFYTNTPVVVNSRDMRAMLRKSAAYPDIKAEMSMYDSAKGVDPSAQAIFATGWETAYPVFLDKSTARRFYFVQDFEPSFYPAGSEAMLAENTYRFGFHGMTAGGWLSHKLHADYGMQTDHFDFAVETQFYNVTNTAPRKEIFFYARPVTPRRGWELGLMALEQFAAARPDITINLAGWDVSSWDIPFPHKNLSGVDISQLNAIYNRCAAGLVLSASNLSLLPLELMASGVTPVVNDAPNNRMVTDNPFIEYVPSAPGAIAKRLIDVVDRADGERSVAMSKSLDGVTWEQSGVQFVQAFERAMRG
ncbi:glycosyltransferase family 1 protein [Cryobacterium roopkundense]|uniref:Glycosyltransferase involved in cell wall biosynthesis n=1 Tax=Cryobacterium roopkundense TaxID=1001240 RepID=A0A7W8ZY29_9MICO|nr:glycosyltransferase family 1 protein [Cryobacterium roopkundense]MBB5642163.1 glycosyltransferase involved in cell wall biosynthesis [Cryobacterium roopkundense]